MFSCESRPPVEHAGLGRDLSPTVDANAGHEIVFVRLFSVGHPPSDGIIRAFVCESGIDVLDRLAFRVKLKRCMGIKVPDHSVPPDNTVKKSCTG